MEIEITHFHLTFSNLDPLFLLFGTIIMLLAIKFYYPKILLGATKIFSKSFFVITDMIYCN